MSKRNSDCPFVEYIPQYLDKLFKNFWTVKSV